MGWLDWIIIGFTWVAVIATFVMNRRTARVNKETAATLAQVESTHTANWIAGYIKGYQAAKAANENEGK